MARAGVKVTRITTRTRKQNNKTKGTGQKRCPVCGKYMGSHHG